MMRNDEFYMEKALLLADEAAADGEAPIGAVIVRKSDGEIVGTGRNTREKGRTALGHAEISAIASACKKLGGWRLSGCEMFVTLEPCPMCAGAIANARLDRVVFGASDTKNGFAGSRANLFELCGSYTIIKGGVMRTECEAQLKSFFGALRKKKNGMNGIKLIKTESAEQVKNLAAIADEIWHEWFPSILSAEQIDYMVEKFQSEKAMTEQMKNDGYEYYYIHRNGEHIGYTAIKNDGKRLFLSKLYIKKEFRGKGYASAAFRIIKDIASERSLRSIWLTVNKYNANSIAVYEKLGFRRIGEGVTDIGNGYVMDDFFYQYDINSVRRIEEADREFFLGAADTFYHTDAVEKPLTMKKLEAIFAEMMRSDVYLEGMILLHNGERAGYAAIAKTFQTESAALTVWVEDLYILPEFRGKGLGNTFFERLFERFDSVTGRYRLEVEPENETAYNLYKKMGFRELGYTEMIKEMN